MPPSNCRDIALELACDYVEGKLDATTTAELETHLGQCPDCMAFLRTYRKATSIARDALRTEIPEACTKMLMDFLDRKLSEP